LIQKDIEVALHWVPSYIRIEGNERADKITKKAANKFMSSGIESYNSFSHITRLVKRRKQEETRKWLKKAIYKRGKKKNRVYSLSNSRGLDLQVFQLRKPFVKRFYQLKLGHAITASYLYRIKKLDSKRCWWCNATNQDIDHLFFECRRWRRQKRILYKDLRRMGILIPTAAEERFKNRLFNTPKAVTPILGFLSTTDVRRRPEEREEEKEWHSRLDRWDLDRLKEEEEV
jgi:hypothetical protein